MGSFINLLRLAKFRPTRYGKQTGRGGGGGSTIVALGGLLRD